MATLVKTQFGWQVQVARRVNDKTLRKAKTFKAKPDVQVWVREFEVGIASGTASSDTMRQVFDRYAFAPFRTSTLPATWSTCPRQRTITPAMFP